MRMVFVKILSATLLAFIVSTFFSSCSPLVEAEGLLAIDSALKVEFTLDRSSKVITSIANNELGATALASAQYRGKSIKNVITMLEKNLKPSSSTQQDFVITIIMNDIGKRNIAQKEALDSAKKAFEGTKVTPKLNDYLDLTKESELLNIEKDRLYLMNRLVSLDNSVSHASLFGHSVSEISRLIASAHLR